MDLAPDGKVFVEGVWEGSAADRAGIRVGARVVSFDSKEATTGNILELVEMIKDRGRRSFVLGVDGGDGTREVRLDKEILFR